MTKNKKYYAKCGCHVVGARPVKPRSNKSLARWIRRRRRIRGEKIDEEDVSPMGHRHARSTELSQMWDILHRGITIVTRKRKKYVPRIVDQRLIEITKSFERTHFRFCKKVAQLPKGSPLFCIMKKHEARMRKMLKSVQSVIRLSANHNSTGNLGDNIGIID